MADILKSPFDLVDSNIALTSDDDYLVIRIDTNRNLGISKTGKSVKIASTPGGVLLGKYRLNVQLSRTRLENEELMLPDNIWFEDGKAEELLVECGQNLHDWTIRKVRLPNDKIMDVCIRRKAWKLLANAKDSHRGS